MSLVLLWTFGAIGGIFWVSWIFRLYRGESGLLMQSVITVGPLIVCLFAVPIVRWLKSPRPVVAFVLFLALIVFASFGWRGGFRHLSHDWLVVMPVLAAGTLGMRWAVATAVVSITISTLVFFLIGPSTGAISLVGSGYPAAFSAVVFVAFFAWFFDRTYRADAKASHQLAVENLALSEVGQIRSEFLAMMSHELRTPLNAIIGFSRISAKRALNANAERDAEVLDSIHETGLALLHRIDDLLDIERLESGLATPDIHSFSLHELLTDVQQEFVDIAGLNEQKLIVESGVQQHIQSDYTRLNRVLSHLVTNAIEHSGSEKIYIRSSIVEKSLLIQVVDEGRGIREQEQLSLFFPRRRGLTKSESSVSLGLYLCNTLTRFVGGRVIFESREGHGSTFSLVFPVSVLNDV